MIDKKELDKINNISDDELRKSISQVAQSAGLDSNTIGQMLSDIGAIRKTVSTVSQNDIDAIVRNLGEENVGKIADILKNNTRGNKIG